MKLILRYLLFIVFSSSIYVKAGIIILKPLNSDNTEHGQIYVADSTLNEMKFFGLNPKNNHYGIAIYENGDCSNFSGLVKPQVKSSSRGSIEKYYGPDENLFESFSTPTNTLWGDPTSHNSSRLYSSNYVFYKINFKVKFSFSKNQMNKPVMAEQVSLAEYILSSNKKPTSYKCGFDINAQFPGRGPSTYG